MDKLSRKQCNAVLRAKASMLMVKENYQTGQKTIKLYRFCNEDKKPQEYIIKECTEIKRTIGKISYKKEFEENTETLKTIAEEMIKIEEILRNPNLPCISSSNQSEPPGWPGQCITLLLQLDILGCVIELIHWGRDKMDDIFVCNFLNENVWILIKISLEPLHFF